MTQGRERAALRVCQLPRLRPRHHLGPVLGRLRRELPDVTLLGLDERSAAVWNADGWRAAGPGVVTVLSGSREAVFKSGSKVLGLPSPVRMLPSL